MATKIGLLAIDLRANSAKFSTDMRKASSALSSSQAKMNRSLRVLDKGFTKISKSLKGTIGRIFSLRGAFSALLVAVGVGALTKMVANSLSAADAIGKVADKVGLTTDELQEMRFAADQTGVAVTALDMGMQRFSRRVGEAANGSGELLGTIERLGISLRGPDGQLRSVTAILGDYAEEVKNADSAQEQLTLAFKGFDSEGAALVNLLRQGREGIKGFKEEAHRLGLVLDESMIRRAEEANDRLSQMRQIVGVNLQRLILGLAPTITRLGIALANAAPQIKAFIESWMPAAAAGPEELAKRMADVLEEINQMQWGAAGDVMGMLGGQGAVQKRVRELTAEYWALDSQLKTATAQQEAMNAAIAVAGAEAATAASAQAQKVIDALIFEQQQSQRSAFVQRIHNELRKAGADITADQATEIANLVGLLNAEEGRRRHLKRLAEEQAEAERERQRIAEEAQAEIDRAQEQHQAVIERWSDSVAQSLTNVILKARTAKDAFRELAMAVASSLVQQAIGSAIGQAVGTLGFAGGKAGGGTVSGGTSYLVGEKGPELFTPGRSGHITPNSGGGGGNTYNIDARGADVSVERRLRQVIQQVNETIEPRAIQAVVNMTARGGAEARLLRGRG